jgi:hypothetical protein
MMTTMTKQKGMTKSALTIIIGTLASCEDENQLKDIMDLYAKNLSFAPWIDAMGEAIEIYHPEHIGYWQKLMMLR